MIPYEKLMGTVRGVSPCKGCTEREYGVCHDNCPKDVRGEFGYQAWKAEIKRVNEEREKSKRIESGKHYSY